jgi:hypothetical protein
VVEPYCREKPLNVEVKWGLEPPKRPDVDYVVDRSQMEAEQSVESSDTNRSSGFKILSFKARLAGAPLSEG